MASESENSPTAADDTVLVDPSAAAGNEQSPTEDAWPVTDLYYVEPSEDAPVHAADDSDDATVVLASASAHERRRFPPDLGGGPALALLAILAVVGAVILGAVLLGADDDDPAAASRTPTNPPATTSTVDTSPAPVGSADIAVRDVVGRDLAEARRRLEEQGLRVRVRRSDSERPAGEVLEQAPPAQAEVAKGTVVALLVARAAAPTQEPAEIEVPTVIGLSASSAVSALRAAGLEARVRLVTSPERSGTVIDQAPAQGDEVPEGTTVRLEVSRARPTVERIEVPDVVGSTAAAARSQLRSAGLRVTTAAVVSPEPAGTVIAQSPRAGAELREGGTVKLTVSTGPAEVEVPDVTGLDESSATLELERAGFQVRVTDEFVDDPAQDGVVLRQSPAGGSAARDGAIVSLTIGRLD